MRRAVLRGSSYPCGVADASNVWNTPPVATRWRQAVIDRLGVTHILLILYFVRRAAIAIPLLSLLGHAGNLAGTTSDKILGAGLTAVGEASGRDA